MPGKLEERGGESLPNLKLEISMQPALVSRAETQVLGLAPVVPISLQASSVIKSGGTSLPVSILGLAPSSSEADGHLHRAPSWTSIVKRVPITDRGINATLLSQHFVGLNRRRGELEGTLVCRWFVNRAQGQPGHIGKLYQTRTNQQIMPLSKTSKG